MVGLRIARHLPPNCTVPVALAPLHLTAYRAPISSARRHWAAVDQPWRPPSISDKYKKSASFATKRYGVMVKCDRHGQKSSCCAGPKATTATNEKAPPELSGGAFFSMSEIMPTLLMCGDHSSSMVNATKRGCPFERTKSSSDLRPASRASLMRPSRSAMVIKACWPASVMTSPARKPFS